jgi:hypothetical protein
MSTLKQVYLRVLFNNLLGIAPSYINEKVARINNVSEEDGFRMLDVFNQMKVIEWADTWDYDLPQCLREEHEAQLIAGKELGLI